MTTKAIARREIVETDYSGDHSIKTVQTVEIEITWMTPDGEAPKMRNPGFSMAGDWKLELRLSQPQAGQGESASRKEAR